MCGPGWASSGFYEWRGRPDSETAERRGRLTKQVRRVFDESDQTYGYRRVHAQLADEGITAGPELVRSIMVAEGLVACQPRPYKATTIAGDEDGPADLCQRDFTAGAPGTKLVGHHLHPHLGGVGVLGHGDRLLLQGGHRLCDG